MASRLDWYQPQVGKSLVCYCWMLPPLVLFSIMFQKAVRFFWKSIAQSYFTQLKYLNLFLKSTFVRKLSALRDKWDNKGKRKRKMKPSSYLLVKMLWLSRRPLPRGFLRQTEDAGQVGQWSLRLTKPKATLSPQRWRTPNTDSLVWVPGATQALGKLLRWWTLKSKTKQKTVGLPGLPGKYQTWQAKLQCICEIPTRHTWESKWIFSSAEF